MMMAVARFRRPTGVRRLEIVDAARILIAERGVQSLAIGNLARAVGVSEGAIYRHFSGKKRIIAGVSFLVISEALMNGDEDLGKLMQAAISRHLETIEAHLKAAARKGEIRADVDIKAAAMQFYGLIQAASALNRFGDADAPFGDSRALWQVFTRGVSE